MGNELPISKSALQILEQNAGCPGAIVAFSGNSFSEVTDHMMEGAIYGGILGAIGGGIYLIPEVKDVVRGVKATF